MDIDEMPVGGGNKKNTMMEEFPPGHVEEKPAAKNDFDEMPIGGGNKKGTMLDEFPPGHVEEKQADKAA